MSNVTSEHYRKKAQEAWHEYIHLRFAERCAMRYSGTPCSGKLECAHLVTKAVKSVRYHPFNGLLLCNHHHQHASNAPHKSPALFEEWLQVHYPGHYEFYITNRFYIGKVDYDKQYKVLQEWIALVKCPMQIPTIMHELFGCAVKSSKQSLKS